MANTICTVAELVNKWLFPDIDSDPEIIGSETVTDGKSSSTQLTLLDRLKSPTLSDLASSSPIIISIILSIIGMFRKHYRH